MRGSGLSSGFRRRSKDLNRATEGDGAVTSSHTRWFTGFENRGDNCLFPNGWNIAVVYCNGDE